MVWDLSILMILIPSGWKLILVCNKISFKAVNCTILKNIPDGMSVHNIELKPGKGAQMARSACTYARIMAKEKGVNLITWFADNAIHSGIKYMYPEEFSSRLSEFFALTLSGVPEPVQ